MKYGFIIDNRKCIGCHACTTACKSEHEVPVGVNRTWVKQVEKGVFPDSRRLFSVMRCNHCTDAPCVDICPTEALFVRSDGIVDFDKDRCIGCKSCMQACPYDALYIDPETHTAAKCNYCAHRIDIGLEPACVNVCPEEAIISGDLENPNSKIAQHLSQFEVKTRKPEKETKPNLFYIDADDVSLVPDLAEPSNGSLWGSQAHGVGHFAKEAEKLAFTNTDLIAQLVEINGGYQTNEGKINSPKTVEVVMDQAKEVYNTPNKGILWGWEVSAYIWTKAIAAGMILVPLIAYLFSILDTSSFLWQSGTIVSLVFLTLTGILLILDLDQPKRFAYVLLRPHWGSWLVKGGYAITIFGGILAFILTAQYFNWTSVLTSTYMLAGALAIIVAIYTAFLFAQAKGRDFWQSKLLSIHMLLHALMAGVSVYYIFSTLTVNPANWLRYLAMSGIIFIVINLLVSAIELFSNHSTSDASAVADMIKKGKYKNRFWIGSVIIGNVIPLAILVFAGLQPIGGAVAGTLMLIGMYIHNHIWIEAPQTIALS